MGRSSNLTRDAKRLYLASAAVDEYLTRHIAVVEMTEDVQGGPGLWLRKRDDGALEVSATEKRLLVAWLVENGHGDDAATLIRMGKS